MKKESKTPNDNGLSPFGGTGAARTCPHKHKELRTLAHYVTVEVTALFCTDCGKQLTKEQWDT